MTYLPVNARSECVAPSTRPFGGVVDSIRMFHAACAASQRPALRPTRGSGDGAVADTMGATGGGMTAGAGGGGGGGVPRPPAGPMPPAGAAADGSLGGVAAAAGVAAPAGGGGVTAGGGVAAGGGVTAGGGVVAAGGVGCGAAAGGVLGATAGGAVFEEPAHAATPNALPASRNASNNATIHLMGVLPPASCSFDRSRWIGRRRRRTRSGRPSRPAPRRTP